MTATVGGFLGAVAALGLVGIGVLVAGWACCQAPEWFGRGRR